MIDLGQVVGISYVKVLFVLCHVNAYSSLAESFSLHFALEISQSH
jgi:hypothetical protein